MPIPGYSGGITRSEMQEFLGRMEDRLNYRLDGIGERLERLEGDVLTLKTDMAEVKNALGRIEPAVLGLLGDEEAAENSRQTRKSPTMLVT